MPRCSAMEVTDSLASRWRRATTRPLGAVAENAVEIPVAQGGLGVGTTLTSGALLAVLAILVGYQQLTHHPPPTSKRPAR